MVKIKPKQFIQKLKAGTVFSFFLFTLFYAFLSCLLYTGCDSGRECWLSVVDTIKSATKAEKVF